MTGSSLSSSSLHHRDSHLDQPFPNFGLRHPAWAADSITRSTGGESMRIATVRQLSRALGAILAECTANRNEAQRRLADAEEKAKNGVKNFAELLNMTVGVIAQASDLEEATALVVRTWKELARENEIGTDKLLQGLVATTKKSCEEMLQQLLLRPSGENMSQSMDGAIQTIFGVNGDVERIRIQAIAGRFSSYLGESLGEATWKYRDEKRRVQEAGGDPGPVTPQVASISLIKDWRGYNQNVSDLGKMKPNFESIEYKATSADFMSAYLAATFKYAAVAYADRWREGLQG